MVGLRDAEANSPTALGSVDGGPGAELLFSIVADEHGAHVQVFAHDPGRKSGGTVAMLGASNWDALKTMVREVDDEIATNPRLALSE